MARMRITPVRPWLAAMLAALAPFAATVQLVAATPRAAAGPEPDDGFYLDELNGLPIYQQHSKQTLLQEGHKVCDAIHRGASEDTATDLVRSDLGASTYQAYRLVGAVEVGLDCFAPKVHGQ